MYTVLYCTTHSVPFHMSIYIIVYDTREGIPRPAAMLSCMYLIQYRPAGSWGHEVRVAVNVFEPL